MAYIAADEGGGLKVNPLADWSVGVDPVDDRSRPIPVVDWTSLRLFQEAFAAAGSLHLLVWEILISTGGRVSEVAGLRRRDVDLLRQVIWVRRPLLEVNGVHARLRALRAAATTTSRSAPGWRPCWPPG